MQYRILLDGVDYGFPFRGQDEFSTKLNRKNGISISFEDLYREVFDGVEIEFGSDGYCWFCEKKRTAPCGRVLMNIELRHDEYDTWKGLYDFYVYVNNLKFNHHKKMVSIEQARDATYGALMLRFIDKEISFYASKTIGCVDMNRLPVYDFGFIDSSGVWSYTAKGFKIHEVFDFLVRHISDNTLYVVSSYLASIDAAICLGGSLSGLTDIYSIYPKVSLSKLFTEIRKKYRIAAAVEYDVNGFAYIRIENEDYFYQNNQLFSIDGIPYALEESTSQDVVFGSIKIGSSTTDISDSVFEIHKNKPLTAWLEEEYLSCSNCVGYDATGQALGLVSEFIIDGNVILDTIQNGGADNDIFLFHYQNSFVTISGISAIMVVANTDAVTGKWYHNLQLNNENVINRWFGALAGCFAVSRYSPYSFRAVNDDDSTSGYPNADILRLIGNYNSGGVFTQIATDETYINFGIEEYDINNLFTNNITENTLSGGTLGSYPATPGNYIRFVNGGGCYYTIPLNGNYAFGAEINAIVNANVANPPSFDPPYVNYVFKIQVYSDNTMTTLLQTTSIAVTDNTPTAGVLISLNSPLWTLLAGNVVTCKMEVNSILYYGAETAFNFYGGHFELIQDDNSCVNINETPLPVRQNEYTFEHHVCYNDYLAIFNNKYDYILLNGIKAWIKELKYNPNAKSTLTLVSNESMC